MAKVYAVTSGAYSDYRINAIFSSKQRAQEFMDAIPNNGYNGIEEYEIDPDTADLIRRWYHIWEVLMLRNGDVERAWKLDICPYTVTSIGHRIWQRSQSLLFAGKNVPDCLDSTVWAKTEKQAIKIVNEQRTQLIANGKWPE